MMNSSLPALYRCDNHFTSWWLQCTSLVMRSKVHFITAETTRTIECGDINYYFLARFRLTHHLLIAAAISVERKRRHHLLGEANGWKNMTNKRTVSLLSFLVQSSPWQRSWSLFFIVWKVFAVEKIFVIVWLWWHFAFLCLWMCLKKWSSKHILISMRYLALSVAGLKCFFQSSLNVAQQNLIKSIDPIQRVASCHLVLV